VVETVRRQVGRVFGRPVAQEEEVIRRRFTLYMSLSAPKVETMRSLTDVIEDIVAMTASQKHGDHGE
jgi:hypothetical protein